MAKAALAESITQPKSSMLADGKARVRKTAAVPMQMAPKSCNTLGRIFGHPARAQARSFDQSIAGFRNLKPAFQTTRIPAS